MTSQTLTLDLRDDIRQGREPFSKIMSAAAGLQAGDQLLLIAPFEPVPLFGVLERQGFTHQAERTPSGDWQVAFKRQSTGTPASAGLIPDLEHKCTAEVVEVDARGLEPPQPLVKILEAIAGLGLGAELKARTDRRPMHLYAHLDERGFSAETQEQPDGTFLTHVRRS